jgi:hypothetical protein
LDPTTKEKGAVKPRVLIFVSHGSHIMENFIDFCLKNNVRPLIIPLHASHLVQPLDLAISGPLKTLLSGKLSRVTKLGIHQFGKLEWLLAYTVVQPVALRARNIADGFR